MVVVLLVIYLVILPAIAGLVMAQLGRSGDGRQLAGSFHAGDRIVYRKQKASNRPGPRAREVYAAPFGETYSYMVDKFWRVQDLTEDGRIVATTRTHKVHYLNPNDPNLHKAGWIERLRYRSRFPQIEDAED